MTAQTSPGNTAPKVQTGKRTNQEPPPEEITIKLTLTARDFRAIHYRHGRSGYARPQYAAKYLRECLGRELEALELRLQDAEEEDPTAERKASCLMKP